MLDIKWENSDNLLLIIFVLLTRIIHLAIDSPCVKKYVSKDSVKIYLIRFVTNVRFRNVFMA